MKLVDTSVPFLCIKYMDWLWQDLRFGIRSLLGNRGSLLACVLALALGIGSASVIFSVIDNVLLEPFPYRDANRLFIVQIHDTNSTEPYGRSMFSQPEFLDYQQQAVAFDGSIGADQDRVLWTGSGPPDLHQDVANTCLCNSGRTALGRRARYFRIK